MLPFPIISNTTIREKRFYKKFVTSRISLGLLSQDSTNSLYGMGDDSRLGLGVPFTGFVKTISDVKDVWSNTSWSFVLKNDGTYWWSGSSNPFGIRTTVPWSNVSSSFNSFGIVKKMCVSSSSIFVLNTVGEVWAVGGNGYGSYGNGTTTTSQSFIKLPLTNVKDIFTKDDIIDNLFVLKNDGTIVGSGYNGTNLLGSANPSTNPSFITLNTDVVDVYVMYGALFVKKSDGTWYVQGQNSNGQLGNGLTSGVTDWIVLPFNLSTIKSIHSYQSCTHIIGTDNNLYFSGYQTSTYPIGGANTIAAPWNNYMSSFTQVPGTDPAIISQLKDIIHFGTGTTYFITDFKIYGCGNSGNYSLLPNYGSSKVVIGFQPLVTPSLS
ncbi:hypothetical protein pEaSNUABM49_00577 [Erwinia phage pEa_SNUABM_49]|nr:hypothetical protein pEaSNUABM49_00577 [Erwinia phage pEa_SNUABM_49]